MSAGLFAEPRGRAWRIVDADMIEVFRDVGLPVYLVQIRSSCWVTYSPPGFQTPAP